MISRRALLFTVLANAGCLESSTAQQPWSVDTTFRIDAQERGASSVIPLPDGKVIVSGGIQFPGNANTTRLSRLNAEGSRDLSFFESGFGGSTITLWNDRFYAEGGTTVRRFLMDGQLDPTFIEMNSGPYFSSLQAGDFHIYPDGRVLLAGAHDLQDPVRGYNGLYHLIWFSNTGYLDTTRAHRRGTGALREIEPLPNGQFLVCGIGSQFEDQSVGRIFRVNDDGSLDPTLQTGVNWGTAACFLPLPDGRFYTGGVFRIAGSPNDTLRLVRFMPNGELDPSFNAPQFTYFGQPDPGGLGPFVNTVQFIPNGNILVTGNFQKANGQFRRGVCVLDTTGALMADFSDAGVGLYYDNGFPLADVSGYTPLENGMAYVYGYYHGYNDGTTNDTLQRFVTRLYGPDFTTAVEESTEQHGLEIYPNPASHTLRCVVPNGTSTQMARLIVRDVSGRSLLTHSVNGDQEELDVSGLANGVYLLELLDGHTRRSVQRLVVQH